MRKIILLTMATCSILLTSCGDLAGYKKTPSGVYYRFEQQNMDAQQVQAGDVLIGEVTTRLDKSYTDHKVGCINDILLEQPWYHGPELYEALSMLHQGDHVIFAIEADSVKKLSWYLPRAYKTGKGMKLYYDIKLQDIATTPAEIFTSRENIQRHLDGKTWTMTKGPKGWCRLHFENGKAYFYFIYNPSDKSWGKPWYALPYKIEEHWSNGEKEYYVSCYDGNVNVLAFSPITGVLGTLLGSEIMDYGL